jgi:hypothetical protein
MLDAATLSAVVFDRAQPMNLEHATGPGSTRDWRIQTKSTQMRLSR